LLAADSADYLSAYGRSYVIVSNRT